MRRQQHVLEGQEVGQHRRFVLVHVEPGAGDEPVLERPRERGFVDDRSARGVDEICGALHPRQRRLVDQVSGVRGERAVQRHDVGGGEQLVERHRLGPFHHRRTGTPGQIGHADAKRRGARGDGAADPAEADDPELLAAQLGAEHEIERPGLPASAPHQAVAFGDTAHDAENQRPGEIGGGLGEHVGRVGDDHAQLARRVHVDVVDADRHRRHHLEVWQPGLEHGAIHGVGQQRNQPLLAAHAGHELVVGQERVAIVEIDVAGRFEARQRGRRQPLGDEHGGSGH